MRQGEHYGSSCIVEGCPAAPAHRRLTEAHRYWHQAADAYQKPEEFAAALNACIQALRNVTFVLQAQKNAIKGFSEWYAAWQVRLRNQPLMNWLVDARNQIVKQGDLKTASTARVTVMRGYTAIVEFERDLDPLLDIDGLALAAIDGAPDTLRDRCLLGIERRWVDEKLADREVLEALATAYGELAALLADCDALISGGATRVAVEHVGAPQCMTAQAVTRKAWATLDHGELFGVEETMYGRPPEEIAAFVRDRYGLPEAKEPEAGQSQLSADMQMCAELARSIFEKDGYHDPMVVYFPEGGTFVAKAMPSKNQTELQLVMEIVGANVEHMRAERVIWVSEMWMAPAPGAGGHYVTARDSPDRIEVLAIHGLSRDGEERVMGAVISRAGEKTALSPMEQMDVIATPFTNAIKRAWKRMGFIH